jgi:hypothetical protein
MIMHMMSRRTEMQTIRTLIERTARFGPTRFGRYYGGVLGTGAGYPTADEARKDLRNYQLSQHVGWPSR